MSEKLAKGDFIELEFTGRIKNGEIFDSTKKEYLEQAHAGHNHPIEDKPFMFSLGHEMFLKKLDDFLIGKELGKEYEVELTPEESFGERKQELIHRIPMSIFKEHKLNPVPGLALNFDGKIGRVMAVSGGRVMVDFNNALAGKDLVYTLKPLKKVSDTNEKVKAMNEFFFRQDFPFEVKDKKLILTVDEQFVKLFELFKDKYKEILGLDLEVKANKKG